MKNGLYSIHMHMLDGVKGRDSGVLILRDGMLLGGGPHFWSTGSYTVGNDTWKGQLSTDQHTGFADPFVRPIFAGEAVASGFSGTFTEDAAAAFGTVLVGRRSLSFRATLKRLADACDAAAGDVPVKAVDRCGARAGGAKGIRNTRPVRDLWICCG